MSDPLVGFEKRDGLAIVTFNNPPRGYLNQAQVAELAAHLDVIEKDDGIRAVIFTGGVPGVFIRHYDVGEIQGATDAVQKSGLDAAGLMEAGKRGNPISHLFDRVDQLHMPTIAAINGFCQGGGFEFALCCDIRIAERGDYRIGLPETNIGIFPGAGGTQRLPRVIGEARALELILRGKTVAPAEAAEIGMVHHLAENTALELAYEIAEDFKNKPARALADAKALVKSATTTPLSDGCANERGRFSALLLEDQEATQLMAEFMASGEDINT
ncbi:MAG: enoyl-CoA hydratase/isomerase family protein [Rhodobiaceae bacterium]|nr:enoyl-CoA hydratase/isomerase family protein [Rhodobiaceae bacterium]